jgi:AraC family transcriptional regulator
VAWTRRQDVGEALLAWVGERSRREVDAFGGRFEPRASASWDGVRVLEGRSDPYERDDGHFPRHVLVVNDGDRVPFEARLPGRRWMSGAVAPRQVNFWPAGMPHAVRWLGAGNWQVIEIDPRFVDSVAASIGIAAPPAFEPAVGREDPLAAHLAAALVLDARTDGVAGRLVGESLGVALVGHLLHGLGGSSATLAPTKDAAQPGALRADRVRLVADFVEARLDGDLSLGEMAGLLGMDVFRFSRAFKAATGCSPHRYVVLARVARAKLLLRGGRLSISEIAMRTGFATPSHFSATFRRVTGTTPRGWQAG